MKQRPRYGRTHHATCPPAGNESRIEIDDARAAHYSLTEELEKLCAAAIGHRKTGKTGSPVTKNGKQFCDYIRLWPSPAARRNEALAHCDGRTWILKREQLTIGAQGDTKNLTARIGGFQPSAEKALAGNGEPAGPDSQWLFPSPQRGDKDIHAQTFANRWNSPARTPKSGTDWLPRYAALFISYCVMCGIDYMTIAEMVGHRDGGILIGKVYGHLADDHTKAQRERVNFGPR